MSRKPKIKQPESLPLPHGWRDVRAASTSDFRWLGLGTLHQLLDSFECELKTLDVVAACNDRMYQKYHMDYYKKRYDESVERWRELSRSESVILEAMAGAADKPILPQHRPSDHFDGCKEAYVWLSEYFLPNVSKNGYYKLKFTEEQSEFGHVTVALPKYCGFEQVIHVPFDNIAILKPIDLQYLCYDLDFASYMLSYYGYDDETCRQFLSHLMSLRQNLAPPCDFVEPGPVPSRFAP